MADEKTEGSAEKRLCGAAGRAEPAEFGPKDDSIDADLIRRLALSIPLSEGGDPCQLTPFGIRIEGATIKGDVVLDRAVPPCGSPLCPMEFEECRFQGRFSGKHARFSRLSFRKCTFEDPPAESAATTGSGCAPKPTVDLSGASFGADLHFAQSSPYGFGRENERPRHEGNHFWIRMVGARIDGELDLCDCHLRAPPPWPHLISDNGEEALDLTLCEIRGDLQLVGCRLDGRVKMRAAHVGGDAWMSAAEIDNDGDEALFMQGARIDGLAAFDGRFERRGEDAGRFRRFKCIGEMNLSGVRIGRDLHINNAVVRGQVYGRSLSIGGKAELDGEFSGPIDLGNCRIGSSLDITGLNLGSEARRCDLSEATVGGKLMVGQPALGYRLRRARSARLGCLPGFELVETLWEQSKGKRLDPEKDHPPDRRWVQAAFLVKRRWGDRRILHLDGHARALRQARRKAPLDINAATALEYARIHGAYVQSSAGRVRLQGVTRCASPIGSRWQSFAFRAFGSQDDVCREWRVETSISGRVIAAPVPGSDRVPACQTMPRFRNGLTVAAPQATDDAGPTPDWLDEPAIPKLQEDPSWFRLERHFACHIDWNPLLQADVNLDGFTCDMLDDNGGRAWGEHPHRISMNHFVYRRVTWGSDKSNRKTSLQLIGGGALQWLARGLAGWTRWFDRFGEPGERLEPWEVRRNWIYRQFLGADKRISPGSSRVRDFEFRPQTFEQAILVARAEGREEIALKFEVLRSRIEWYIFNRLIRWTLAPVALIVGSSWLAWDGGKAKFVAVALVVTLALMAMLSYFGRLGRARHWVWRALLNSLLWVPAIILLIASGWWKTPFSSIAALLIYFAIRYAAVFSNAVMWIGTGYLRKPINAFLMLVGAFLAGWYGVHEANSRNMIVVETQPTAGVAGEDTEVGWARKPPYPYDEKGPAIVMGAARAAPGQVYREMPCGHDFSEPLFALDVLVPLVDLHEESRCGVRRFAIPHPEEHRKLVTASAQRPACSNVDPKEPKPSRCMNLAELATAFPARALDDHRFWWWMRAIYAIAGWFLVSLALLTFAQVNRTRGEFAEG